VRSAQRVDHVDGLGVVNLFCANATSFANISANCGDNVRAPVPRHLHRMAADPAGCAHHNDALARRDGQQLV
jgi:hypothetical protein